jgi:hypothetical protein
MHQESGSDGRPPAETIDRWAFAETVEDGSQGRRFPVRLGPAVGAAVVALLIVVGITVVPQLTSGIAGGQATGAGQSTTGQGTSGQGTSGQTGTGQQMPADSGQQPTSGQGGSSSSLTYANHTIVGPGSACCWTSGGTWSNAANGGYPEYSGPVRTSADPASWFEWNLGQPTGGARWDQVKVRVWLPQSQAGAWVRLTVTTTAAGATNVASFDVAEQEYEGWYELPATFTIGTPDRRTGSAWVKMTYLRPYTDPAARSACADGSCSRIAAAQAEFLWS